MSLEDDAGFEPLLVLLQAGGQTCSAAKKIIISISFLCYCNKNRVFVDSMVSRVFILWFQAGRVYLLEQLLKLTEITI